MPIKTEYITSDGHRHDDLAKAQAREANLDLILELSAAARRHEKIRTGIREDERETLLQLLEAGLISIHLPPAAPYKEPKVKSTKLIGSGSFTLRFKAGSVLLKNRSYDGKMPVDMDGLQVTIAEGSNAWLEKGEESRGILTAEFRVIPKVNID